MSSSEEEAAVPKPARRAGRRSRDEAPAEGAGDGDGAGPSTSAAPAAKRSRPSECVLLRAGPCRVAGMCATFCVQLFWFQIFVCARGAVGAAARCSHLARAPASRGCACPGSRETGAPRAASTSS